MAFLFGQKDTFNILIIILLYFKYIYKALFSIKMGITSTPFFRYNRLGIFIR